MSKKIVLLAALGFLNNLSWGAEYKPEELTVTILNQDQIRIIFADGRQETVDVFNCVLYYDSNEERLLLKDFVSHPSSKPLSKEEEDNYETERKYIKEFFNIKISKTISFHSVRCINCYWYFYKKRNLL